MGNFRKDRTGESYNSLTVIGMAPMDRSLSVKARNRVHVICKCGTTKVVGYANI